MDSIPHDGGCSPIGVLSIWLEFEGISALLLSDFAKPLARFHCSFAVENPADPWWSLSNRLFSARVQVLSLFCR